MMVWFIDSWAVRDGFAFASERESDSTDAVQTVFIGPPGFEAIPVAKISTALAAARGHFQEGLRDADGSEIPFDTLEQIIEMVRRAFLQGGSGFLPPAGPPGPEGPPLGERPIPPEDVPPQGVPPDEVRPGPGDPGEAVGGGSSGSWNEINRRIRGLEERETRVLLATSFEERWTKEVDSQLLTQFVEDVVRELVRRLINTRHESVSAHDMTVLLDTTVVWIGSAYRLGLLKGSLPHLLEPLADDDPASAEIVAETSWPHFNLVGLLQQSILRGLFHRVPLPSQWKLNGFGDIASVGDLLNSVAADRNRLFEVINDWVSFVPIVYCSLAISASAVSPWLYSCYHPAHPPPRSFLQEVRHNAAAWLSDLLPGKELDEHESGHIISSLEFHESESRR